MLIIIIKKMNNILFFSVTLGIALDNCNFHQMFILSFYTLQHFQNVLTRFEIFIDIFNILSLFVYT